MTSPSSKLRISTWARKSTAALLAANVKFAFAWGAFVLLGCYTPIRFLRAQGEQEWFYHTRSKARLGWAGIARSSRGQHLQKQKGNNDAQPKSPRTCVRSGTLQNNKTETQCLVVETLEFVAVQARPEARYLGMSLA